jgi:phage shock protein B
MSLMPLLSIGVFVLIPLWLFLRYRVQSKRALSGLSGQEQQRLADLQVIAKRLDARVNALEQILDNRVPNWRQHD